MRIAVWWEQTLSGGVDTHLLTLLRNWPEPKDEFVIFYNVNNQGVKRIWDSLIQLSQVTLVSYGEPSSILPGSFGKIVRYFWLPVHFLSMKRRARRLLNRYGSFDALLADNGGYPAAWATLAALWAGSALGFRVNLLLVHHAATARAGA